MKKRTTILKLVIMLTALVLTTLGAAPAGATSLNLTLDPIPDIFLNNIGVTYNSVADTFSASGYALTLTYGSAITELITGGIFSLSATINDSGALSGGTLAIGGTTSSFHTSGALLTGNLSAFGFNTADDPFEFLFTITGGDAANLYGGNGATGGLILSELYFDPDASPFQGNFSMDWQGQYGVADVKAAPVPEPATMTLLGIGLIGLTGLRRKMKK